MVADTFKMLKVLEQESHPQALDLVGQFTQMGKNIYIIIIYKYINNIIYIYISNFKLPFFFM